MAWNGVEIWKQEAACGVAEAQYNLGELHRQGLGGLTKDGAKAVALYRKAAAQGYAEAQSKLGLMYEQGRGGLSQDDAKAVEWWQKALETLGQQQDCAPEAAQGCPAAQRCLARMYELGRGGLEKDERQAAELYHEAAIQGDTWAQQLVQNGVCPVLSTPPHLPAWCLRLRPLSFPQSAASAAWKRQACYGARLGPPP